MDDKATNIMNHVVVWIGHDATLREAVDILAENIISGLPVVDEAKKVIGIITERDILEYFDNHNVTPLISSSNWASQHNDVSQIASFRKGFELMDRTKVEEVMTQNVVKADTNTSCSEILSLMKKKNINRLPVVDGEGKLSGIVTRTDILNYLAEQYNVLR